MESIMTHNADIAELSQRMHLGPQAEVLELIEDFNSLHISTDNNRFNLRRQAPRETKKLGITKKFGWKPGAYDTIRAIINGAQSFNMKAQSLGKVVDRVRNEGIWRIRNIDDQVARIERILFEMRRNGIVMQDNSDDAVEAYQLLKNHFIEQEENNNGFRISVTEDRNDYDTVEDYTVYVAYKYTRPMISFSHTSGSRIADFTFQGDVYIMVRYSLSKLINLVITNQFDLSKLTSSNVTNKADVGKRRGVFATGGYIDSDYAIRHPYISAGHYGGRHHEPNFRYVCFGNIMTESHACFGSLDFISGKIFVDRLVYHYDTSTGPLNRINYAYHGIPDELYGNDEYANIHPFAIAEECTYNYILEDMPQDIIETDSYCANHCSFKDNCSLYKRLNVQITAEEKERQALEQATINAARRI